MNIVQRNVLKSLRDRVELATKRIKDAEQEIVYQNKIITESKELIEKLLQTSKGDTEEGDDSEMQNMQLE